MLQSLVKGPLSNMIKEKVGLSGEQSEKAAEVSADSVGKDLKDEASKGNLSQIQSMLGGDTSNNPMADKMSTNVVSNLTSKLGLDKGIASKISAMAIPFIMNKVSSKTGGKADAGALSGLLGGNIQEKIGGFFK